MASVTTMSVCSTKSTAEPDAEAGNSQNNLPRFSRDIRHQRHLARVFAVLHGLATAVRGRGRWSVWLVRSAFAQCRQSHARAMLPATRLCADFFQGGDAHGPISVCIVVVAGSCAAEAAHCKEQGCPPKAEICISRYVLFVPIASSLRHERKHGVGIG